MLQVDGKTRTDEGVAAANARLERCLDGADLGSMAPEEMLRWASERFPGRAAISTSFQRTGMVMLDMACRHGLELRLATVDTLRLHPETYEFMRQVEARYGRRIEVARPEPVQVQRMVSLVNEYGTARRILKLAPLAEWSEDAVQAYCREHEVPVHPLYDQGYSSFGCIICATPVRPGEPERAGRWRWFNGAAAAGEKECGLHYSI